MIITSDDLTIRIATFKNARKVQHIQHNPEVHLNCGVTDPEQISPYLQIQGKGRLDVSSETRHDFWQEWMQPIFQCPDDPNYGVLEITPYMIEIWSPGKFEPETWSAD